MSRLTEYFYFSVFTAAFLLSMMGLWFTAVIPGIDRWSKRFFLSYFTVFLLCCISTILEMLLYFSPVPIAVIYFVLILECLLLSMPLPMLTVYLLHCCGENLRANRLLRIVLGVWAVYLALLAFIPFIGGFSDITPDGQYSRGPLYPLLLLPVLVIQLLNLAGTAETRMPAHFIFPSGRGKRIPAARSSLLTTAAVMTLRRTVRRILP